MKPATDDALKFLILQLNSHLQDAARATDMAASAICNERRNQAIGCLIEAERQIREIADIFNTILVVHRTNK